MRESALQARILRELNAVPGCKAVKLTPVEVGSPDIIGSYLGRAFVIEVKVGGKKPRRIQSLRLAQWAAAGAVAGEAREAFETAAFLLRFV